MDTPSSQSEEEGQPQKVPCESLRITYEDPLTCVHRAEEVFLDPRDLWSRGKSLLLVNSGALLALQAKSDQEQSFALSSQSATEKCRRDYLREQRLLVDELQRLLELESNLPKAMQAEAQATIEAANGDQAADVGRMGFTASEERLAVELYVPRGEDEEILQHLQGAKVELGDEVCTRLLVQKVRSIHADVLKQREGMRIMLEELADSDLASDKGPGDLEGRQKLIRLLITQAQGQGASWTEIAMTIMDAAAKLWAQLKEEEEVPGAAKNVVQETEDVMTDRLAGRHLALVQQEKEDRGKLEHFYGLLAQQEEQAAQLMELKSKAEESESKAEIKEAEEKSVVAGYQQRHAAREAKRQRVRAERTQQARQEKEQARRQYVAMKRELQAAAQAAEEQQDEAGQVSPEKADEYVMKQMSAEEKVRLKKLEQAVSAFQEKQTTMETRIESLNQKVTEAKELKETTLQRVAQAKVMLEEKKKEAKKVQEVVQRAEERRRYVVSQAQELARKKIHFANEAVERKSAAPPDVEAMISKMEQELEKVKLPCEELCRQEARLLEKEKRLQRRIKQRSEEAKALRERQAQEVKDEPKKKAAEVEAPVVLERKQTGYRARAEGDPSVPRHVQLFQDQQQRAVEREKLQQEKVEAQAAELLARLPRYSEEEKEELRQRAPAAQAPVWFMRDEDLRVKVALASQNASQLDRVLQESRLRSEDLKKGLLSCSQSLAESFSDAAELLVAAPRALAEDAALRTELRQALLEHEALGASATEAWRLAEQGCAAGASGLLAEEQWCSEREEALAAACRGLYELSRAAPGTAAKGYELQWLRAEKKLRHLVWQRSRAPTWQMAHHCAERLQVELATQQELSRLLEAELKHKVLLDAELLAPPEAKRAIASLQQLTRHESPQRVLSPQRLLA